MLLIPILMLYCCDTTTVLLHYYSANGYYPNMLRLYYYDYDAGSYGYGRLRRIRSGTTTDKPTQRVETEDAHTLLTIGLEAIGVRRLWVKPLLVFCYTDIRHMSVPSRRCKRSLRRHFFSLAFRTDKRCILLSCSGMVLICRGTLPFCSGMFLYCRVIAL